MTGYVAAFFWLACMAGWILFGLHVVWLIMQTGDAFGGLDVVLVGISCANSAFAALRFGLEALK